MTRQQPTRKLGAGVVDSRSKQCSSENQQSSSAKKQPSSSKQQPSSANHQLKEKQVVDTADSRLKQIPMKRAVMEDNGNSRTEQESSLKKTKIIPMCRSNSVEEFLKENGENGEDEDEGEKVEEEENITGEEENTEQIESETIEG
ncbi:hypothetical protein RYX36_026133 [Vicia faba]